MATKKTETADLKNVQSINFTYQGKTYTLEFNRDTTLALLDEMEDMGFHFGQDSFVEAADKNPVKYMRVLNLMFHKAFEMHHPNIDSRLVDEMLDKLDKTSFWEVLFALVEKPINSLTGEGETKAGEIKWEVVR